MSRTHSATSAEDLKAIMGSLGVMWVDHDNQSAEAYEPIEGGSDMREVPYDWAKALLEDPSLGFTLDGEGREGVYIYAMPLRQVVVLNKKGDGIGATLEVWFRNQVTGHLTLNEGGEWQLTHGNEEVDCAIYEQALSLARKLYPNG